MMELPKIPCVDIPPFDREFFTSGHEFSRIGHGGPGGKANGLITIRQTLADGIRPDEFPGITLSIPRFCVLATDVFDAFMEQNNLYDVALSDQSDDHIAYAFQRAEFPAAHVGDLMGLIGKVHQPLAIRSSSLLEDEMNHPFAGVYETKMIPNNQFDVETRFHKLIEAVKFVYASMYFRHAKAYIDSTERRIEEEKMAVIIQEILGERHEDRFYPTMSGVARSYNFYPTGRAKPEDGVVNLALGLGKTVVDGSLCWTYSPAFPRLRPPVGSLHELIEQTQTEFWAVNMGKPPAYDPIRETEYLVHPHVADAEKDETLRFLASTYDAQSDRLSPGITGRGPRVLTFSPILELEAIPLNPLLVKLLKICEEVSGAPVEIEFAVTLDPERGVPSRFAFLQVRPMIVSHEPVDIDGDDLMGERVLLASESVMGNGTLNTIRDVVYVKPETFEAKYTPVIADELTEFNKNLAAEKRPYLLIGFGRWGSSDPWLGIPVSWGRVSGARAIVEATLPQMNIELSQGSHFFHNLISFRVSYFSVHHDSPYKIQWEWLNQQEKIAETRYLRHVRLSSPLEIRVDGRTGRGVISHS